MSCCPPAVGLQKGPIRTCVVPALLAAIAFSARERGYPWGGRVFPAGNPTKKPPHTPPKMPLSTTPSSLVCVQTGYRRSGYAGQTWAERSLILLDAPEGMSYFLT